MLWLVALGSVVFCGVVAQHLCVRRDRARFPAPGTFAAGLHVCEIGTQGLPVVFEAGIAATSLNWRRLQDHLRTNAHTYSYDRAGLGWSPPAPGDRSLHRWTEDLHRLIRAAQVPRPIVLAGHSFGTYIVRAYAHRFPDDVAALVLVDPVMPEQFGDPDRRTRARLSRAALYCEITGLAAACGLVRLGLWGLLRRGAGNAGPLLGLHPTLRRIAVEVAKLPPEVVPALRAHWSQRRFFRELAASIRAMPACAREASHCPVAPGVPVVVLSGSHHPAQWLRAHESIASRHIVVEGSAHWVHLDRPELVAEAILGARR